MQPIHMFDGKSLSIERIAELSRFAGVVDLSPEAWERVAASRAIVERHLAAGTTIYGTNTGVGSQKDVEVGAANLAEFSNRMIIGEASDFPGPPAARSRGARRLGCVDQQYRGRGHRRSSRTGAPFAGTLCRSAYADRARRYFIWDRRSRAAIAALDRGARDVAR